MSYLARPWHDISLQPSGLSHLPVGVVWKPAVWIQVVLPWGEDRTVRLRMQRETAEELQRALQWALAQTPPAEEAP